MQTAPPGKLNLKTVPPLSLYVGINIRFVFSRLLFLRFYKVFGSIFQ